MMRFLSSRFRRLLYEALIVPSAHTRVFDSEFQHEVYEVFHTRAATRWIHRLCTPIANISLLATATALPFASFDGAILAAIIALLGYLAVHGAWALAMIPVLAFAVAAAHILAGALGPWVVTGGLSIAFYAAFIQTLSHAFEPVPPPWSGSYGWITLKEFLLRTPPLKLVVLSAVAVLIFPVLEFWAAPRIWPVQIIQLLMNAGFRPAFALRTRDRVRAIFADARNGWSLPPLNTDSDPQ
jgi:hypothetical protein